MFVDNLLINEAHAWAGASDPGEPEKEHYCPTRDVFSARLDRCRKEAMLGGMPEQQSYLLHAVLGEIGGNSFDHNLGAWRDIPGTMFRWKQFNGSFISVIVDRGQGVRTTLQRVRPGITTHEEALHVAFLEKLSGRAPERRGNGLKFVRKTLLDDGIDLQFSSGDARYVIEKRREQWETTNTSIPGCCAVITWNMQ